MSTEAMKLALEALEMWCPMTATYLNTRDKAITALQEALAQPQQEPVAWAIFTNAGNARMWSTFQPHLQKLADAEGLTITPLYTSPPAQEFVCSTGLCHYRKPLTDAQINAFFEGMEPNNGFWLSFARAIEAAHGIKGDT